MGVTLCRLLPVCFLLLAASPAHAESPEALARRHYARGAELYLAGNYAAAIVEFEAARAQAVLPAFTYNIARCHERLGHTAAALAEYERFLPTVSDAAEALELRQRIASLRDELAHRQTPPAAPPPPPGTTPEPTGSPAPPPSRPPRASRIAAIALAAFAVGTLAAGTGLYFSARNDYGELERVCATRPCTPGDWSATSTRAHAGYAMWSVAGAAAAVDVVLWIVDARARRGVQKAWVAPTLGGAVAGVSF